MNHHNDTPKEEDMFLPEPTSKTKAAHMMRGECSSFCTSYLIIFMDDRSL
jgi:hypothetical protein